MIRCVLPAFLAGFTGFSAAAEDHSADAYAGSESCAACHEEITRAWESSHHAKAWTLPGPDTVLADFDGTGFEGEGMSIAFSQDETGYRARVMEADGSVKEHVIHSVAGLSPLQQYLIETEPGRLQSFDVAWDVETGEWYHLYPGQQLPPDDALHWTGPYKNWNGRCAECHATGFEKNYDAQRDRYASTQAETGVGCEACHGPGAGHIAWAKTGVGHPGLSMPAAAGSAAWTGQCAGCHSRREPLGSGNPLPGTNYYDAYRLSLLTPPLYHADGQISDEVYVYGSFLQSKMYQKGVGCSNCHEPHSARLRAEGNALCTQCHSPAGNPDFPSLPLKTYDAASHHFHEEGSAGAQCRSCHMPEQLYMGIDARADHSFRIPRPDLSALTGAPDACTACHEDMSQAEAAEEMAARWPDAAKRRHFGPLFAAAQAQPEAARPGLLRLAEDEGEADITRATALWLAEQTPSPESADAAAPLLTDESPLLRAGAARMQRGAPAGLRAQRLIPLLTDKRLFVRITAAQEMLAVPPEAIPQGAGAVIGAAMDEWRSVLANRLDFPETHLQLAGMALTMRNLPAARAAFERVTDMDPQRTDAWIMQIRIALNSRRPDIAALILREALRHNPGDQQLLDMR